MITELYPAQEPDEVFPVYWSTPIADLLAYHNWHEFHGRYTQAELLVGMCMDHRKRLRIPERFAYIMRAGGANFRGLEFQISFAIAIGGVRAIALIGHDQCGMANLEACRDTFVSGLIENAGWSRDAAVRHFDEYAPRFEVGDPADLVCTHARQLRQIYPTMVVAPLMYHLEDGMLYQIKESE